MDCCTPAQRHASGGVSGFGGASDPDVSCQSEANGNWHKGIPAVIVWGNQIRSSFVFLIFRARAWVGNSCFIGRCHFENRVGDRKKSSAAVEICCAVLQKAPSTCRCPRNSPLSECVCASPTFHLQKKEHAFLPFAAGLGLGQPDHFVSLFGRTPPPSRRCALISAILRQNHRGSRPLARRFGKNTLATHRDLNLSAHSRLPPTRESSSSDKQPPRSASRTWVPRIARQLKEERPL